MMALFHDCKCLPQPRASRSSSQLQADVIPTKLFGSAGVGPLHGPAVGIVPAADPALVLSLAGANFLVTAHFLQKKGQDWILAGNSFL